MPDIKELVKGMTPVQMMEMVNEIIKEMSNKGALVRDDGDPDWYIHHLEYREDADEIYFVADTPTVGELGREVV